VSIFNNLPIAGRWVRFPPPSLDPLETSQLRKPSSYLRQALGLVEQRGKGNDGQVSMIRVRPTGKQRLSFCFHELSKLTGHTSLFIF
jgi:hypothetical protein